MNYVDGLDRNTFERAVEHVMCGVSGTNMSLDDLDFRSSP